MKCPALRCSFPKAVTFQLFSSCGSGVATKSPKLHPIRWSVRRMSGSHGKQLWSARCVSSNLTIMPLNNVSTCSLTSSVRPWKLNTSNTASYTASYQHTLWTLPHFRFPRSRMWFSSITIYLASLEESHTGGLNECKLITLHSDCSSQVIHWRFQHDAFPWDTWWEEMS